MVDRGGEFSPFQGIHVRIGIRIDIAISIRPMITKFGHVKIDMRIYIAISIRPMISKFEKQVHLQELTQMRLIKHVLVTSLRQNRVANLKHYISTVRVPIATKLGRMITYLDGFLPEKSRNPLIMWSCNIT